MSVTIPRTSPRRGLTLIELLVTLALIGVLLGLVNAALAPVRMKAVRTACGANMRQIGVALFSYQADGDGKFPHALPVPHEEPGFFRLFPEMADHGSLPVVMDRYIDSESTIYFCPDNDTGNDVYGSGYLYSADDHMGRLYRDTVSPLLEEVPSREDDYPARPGQQWIWFPHGDTYNTLGRDGGITTYNHNLGR